ncbi:hypothetical protein [Clostridium algoriphilum]|nr:hypothetical protein [Clostridium algoriphilum]
MSTTSAIIHDVESINIKRIKVIVGVDKSNLIKSDKRIVACGKNF